MEHKIAVIVIQENMMIGGIETYVFDLIKKVKKDNNTMVWVKKHNARVCESFKPELYDGKVIIWNSITIQKIKKLISEKNIERCIIITFDMFQFASADILKARVKNALIETYYFIPHFVGRTYYLEENFKNSYLKKKTKKRTSKIIKKMIENSNIRFFETTHIKTLNSKYNTKLELNNYRLWVPQKGLNEREFDKSSRKKVFYRDYFNIVTVSRFEFPHKGYLIGLLKSFEILKRKHPNLHLTVIGYGDGKNRIESLIDSFDVETKKAIHLIGQVSPELLDEYYLDANLNISAAGCCLKGAALGVLSLPVRHYTYNCETYDYLPEGNNSLLSKESGKPIEKFIERTIKMPFEEYLEKSQVSFDYYKNISNCYYDYSELYNRSNHSSLNPKDYALIKTISKLYKLHIFRIRFLSLFNRIIRKIKRKG